MKFLAVLFGSVAAASADPIQADYAIPQAAPIAVVPQPAPVLATRVVPLAPSPVRVLAQPLPLPLARAPVPIPVQAPLPAPLVHAAPIPTPVATPFVAAAPAPLPIPAPVSPVNTQFHAQDELGGFNFGYSNGLSTRQEVRTADGVTRGGYSYIDANGVPQTVEYVSDPVNGFRVAGTNIPVAQEAQTVAIVEPVMDTPEVAAAKAEFRAAFEAEVARNAELEAAEATAVVARKKRSAAYSNDYQVPLAPVATVVPAPATPVVVPVPAPEVNIPESQFVEPPTLVRAFPQPAPFFAPAPFAQFPRVIATPAATPIVAQAAPAVLPAPIATRTIPVPAPVATPLAAATPAIPLPAAVPNTQFQAQDELGGFSFGYQNGLSARQESRSADGVTRGSYSYVDANGIVQTVEYTADAVNGFQVRGTNLPVA